MLWSQRDIKLESPKTTHTCSHDVVMEGQTIYIYEEVSKSIYANDAGLDNADSIQSTKLRKHVATASQILALKDYKLETLADFMGHDSRVLPVARYKNCPEGYQTVSTFPELGEGQLGFPTWQIIG